ncbi:MAG: T9SS type A sorting domain-containing protein [Bacteroidales bacterium]|nr:T9SS type A sorting domain-containing protein [Bacteroidales bacterium]
MKTHLYIAFFIIGLFIQSGLAQNVTIAGSDITLTNGTLMNIPGDITFIADVEVENAGIISVGGNWKNNATNDLYLQNGSGSVVVNGASGQIIGGNSRTYFGNLSIEQFVDLENEIHVAGVLQFANAKLSLNKYNLFIGPGGQIAGADGNAYLIAESNGVLVREVGNSEVLFPVGSAASYLPVTMLNTGSTDRYGVNLFSDVLDSGTSGVTIPEIDHCVLNTWYIIEENPGGSNLNISFQWNAENERALFDRSKSGIGNFNAGAWNALDAKPASGNNPYIQTRSDLTTVGAFAVGDQDSPMAIPVVYDEQNIFLPAGWTGISSYLNPADADLEVMLNGIVNQLVILQNLSGVYWPSQGINTIGNWDINSGYQVKMSGEVILTVSGIPMVDVTLDLSEGWNLIPVLSGCDVGVEDLFAGTDLIMVREVAGYKIYWPEFDINTIGTLSPGAAYMVMMGSEDEVVFPTCEKSNSTSYPQESSIELNQDLTWNKFAKTNITHTIAIPVSAFNETQIEEGDFIGAFNEEGKCFGFVEWNQNNTAITLFGDDQTTDEMDGFTEHGFINFRLMKSITNQEVWLEAQYNNDFPTHEGVFVSGGISAIDHFKESSGSAFDNAVPKFRLYPNPAHDKVSVHYHASDNCQLSIQTIHGVEVYLTELNSPFTDIDVSSLSPGLYLVKLNNGADYQVMRLIIK